MDLRAKLIEAGAEALDGMPAALLGAAAGVVLDAFLDVLAENADEWWDAWFDSERDLFESLNREHLAQAVAVLRDSE